MPLINWEKVQEELKSISKDKSRVRMIIEQQIIEILEDTNPSNYNKILSENEHIINTIIDGLTDQYHKQVIEEIERFCKIMGI